MINNASKFRQCCISTYDWRNVAHLHYFESVSDAIDPRWKMFVT